MKEIVIDNPRQKIFCRTMLDEIPEDGTKTVIFKNTDMSATARQQRLEWLWYTEVAQSGLGSDDDKNAVHIRAKWQFARPILLRDDEFFQIIYKTFIKTVDGSALYAEYCRTFADQYTHTSLLSKRQKAEYLTEFQRYWIGKGVELTNPNDLGMNLLKYAPIKEAEK